MSALKAVMFVGGNAPNRDAQLTLDAQYNNETVAYWGPGFDVCSDPECDCRSRIILGRGVTDAEAIADYWEQWSERYEEA